MAYVPNSGSVVAFQGNPSVLQTLTGLMSTNASVITVGTAAPNQSVSGTVAADIRGSVATVIIGGSISASFTPPANQSVSGTVHIDNFSSVTSYQLAGSVLAVSGSFAPAANQSVSGTVQTDVRGSVAVVIIGGSVATATTPTSVMLLGSTAVIGSVMTLQGTNPWITANTQTGTTVTSLVSTVPSSVIVGASIFGQLPGGTATLGSVAAIVSNFPTTQNVSGSVVTFQAGTIVTSLVSTVPSSVIVGASIFGQLPAGTATLGAITAPAGSVMMTAQLAGSVMAVSGSFTPAANQSVSGAVTAPPGSVATALVIGSIATAQIGTTITSVSGTVLTSPSADTPSAVSSILLGVTANTNGSVATVTGYQAAMVQVTSGPGASITAALNWEGTLDGTAFVPIQAYNVATNTISSMATIEGNYVINTTGLQGVRARVSNWSVGSITARLIASPEDARPFAVISSDTQLAGSILATTVRSGSVVSNAAAGSIMAVTVVSGSTLAFAPAGSIMAVAVGTGTAMIGSVTTIQGTNPWAITPGVGATFIIAGSIITVFGQSPSIVGTFAEDAAHATGDKGLHVLAVRNDAITSIAGSDRDYSPVAVDEASRVITSPFAGPKACIISYVGSTVSGSVQLIAASIVGSKHYITDFWLSNTGTSTTLVTFQDGTTSIIGQFIAPAGGGMSSPGLAIPLKPVVAAGSDLAFKVSPSTSVLYAVVKGYSAP